MLWLNKHKIAAKAQRSLMRTLLACLLLCLPLSLFAANIVDVRIWRAPDKTRLVFDLDEAAEHKIFTLKNPHRVVVDIRNAALKTKLNKVPLKNTPLKSIRSAQKDKRDLRVVLDISKEVKPRSFLLKKSSTAGDRLVVDLFDKTNKQKPNTKTVTEVKKANRDLIIAIDAGHGGEDPGALGPKKIREKDVVLAIAKELAYKFKKTKGYKPVLIRSGDYYVGLADRRKKARKAHADMFVSIHADAFTSPKANGSSVFALSNRGATSALAKFLANKANASDLVGGVSLVDKDPILSGVLADLSMTHKLSSSLNVGDKVLKNMGLMSKLHSKHVGQASFAVLKTPDIPSILVETGFISNPGEAKKLSNKSYQRKMANAIYKGIDSYFRETAEEDTYIGAIKKHSDSVYVVENGDTLSGIAQRYAISMKKLSQYNRLKNSRLRIGQSLKIPSAR